MIKYLIELGSFYQPKNKLQKVVQEFFREQDRKVIAGESCKDYLFYFKTRIETLNKQFTNCKPVDLHIWSHDNKDQHIQIESLVGLSMLQFTDIRKCRVCGCTDANCIRCIEKTGMPCSWVETDLCSACVEAKDK